MEREVISCLIEMCGQPARCRGLCTRCYGTARLRIASGLATWEELVEAGLALPAKTVASKSSFDAAFKKQFDANERVAIEQRKLIKEISIEPTIQSEPLDPNAIVQQIQVAAQKLALSASAENMKRLAELQAEYARVMERWTGNAALMSGNPTPLIPNKPGSGAYDHEAFDHEDSLRRNELRGMSLRERSLRDAMLAGPPEDAMQMNVNPLPNSVFDNAPPLQSAPPEFVTPAIDDMEIEYDPALDDVPSVPRWQPDTSSEDAEV